MLSQRIHSFEGFRTTAPRHTVQLCRHTPQVGHKQAMCYQPCSVLQKFSLDVLQAARQQLSLQIRCARVGGVEIPNQKRIEYSLQYVFGVGHTTAKAILAETVQTAHLMHKCLPYHVSCCLKHVCIHSGEYFAYMFRVIMHALFLQCRKSIDQIVNCCRVWKTSEQGSSVRKSSQHCVRRLTSIQLREIFAGLTL